MENTQDEVISMLKMIHLEQYVNKVIDYSQRYNNSNSLYYAPSNLIGKPEMYPLFGDVPETYALKTYGHWWKQRDCTQMNYRPQDDDPLGAEDYIIVEFEDHVIPRDVCIYETYNPGAVIRIWAKAIHLNQTQWILLWEGLPEKPVMSSRKFRPLIKKVNFLTNTIKIELNQSKLSHHTSIDAILLAGYQPKSILQKNMIEKGIINLNIDNCNKDQGKVLIESTNFMGKNVNDPFSTLPYELITHIFHYLDLKSLARCARVNKRWNQIAADPFLYQNLNLKPYWYLVKCETLNYFMKKCKALKKIDLSWCGNDLDNLRSFELCLSEMLQTNPHTLTHISLGNCKYINGDLVKNLSSCVELIDLRLNNINSNFFHHFHHLITLTKLVAVDLTSSEIMDDDLISFLKANANLKHLIIDLCENLSRLDDVVDTVVEFNKCLMTWSSWKTLSLTANGVRSFGQCPNLTELDLGWCLVNKDPGNCLKFVAEGCKKLKRLILSEWRGLNDFLLNPIINECKELVQLDFLGILNITSDLCIKAFTTLPRLRLLDISYCDNINIEEVILWRRTYPHITIQCTLI